jgi:Kef-type K+ transport system membrane component KefB
MTDVLLAQVFLALAFVIGVARLGGVLFERLGQPAVVGEIVAGIAVGPSLLGLLLPELSTLLVPVATRPYLQMIAQLGLVIFMLIIGLEVEIVMMGRHKRLVAAVSGVATLVPFGLGLLLALVIWPWYRTAPGRTPFLLFIGVALAVTAFPVLARIVRDRGMTGGLVGTVAMACAALIDIVAWIVLSVVVSIAAAHHGHRWTMLPMAVAFVAAMLLAVKPLLARATRSGALDRLEPRTMLVAVLVAAVASAWFTQYIGLHSIFGPFVLGVCLPRHRPTVELLTTRLADTSSAFLLPSFFVVAGLSVNVGALDPRDVPVLAATLTVAVVGKVLPAALAARGLGVARHDAWSLGVLLSTRGLTELVVLSVGLSLGILNPHLYTVLVITAVVTTVATGPLLALVRRIAPQRAGDPAHRSAAATSPGTMRRPNDA